MAAMGIIAFLLIISPIAARLPSERASTGLLLSAKQECLEQCRMSSLGYTCLGDFYQDMPAAVECCQGDAVPNFFRCVSDCEAPASDFSEYRAACSLIGLGSSSINPSELTVGCTRAAKLCVSLYPVSTDCSALLYARQACLNNLAARGCSDDVAVATNIEEVEQQIATCPETTPFETATLIPTPTETDSTSSTQVSSGGAPSESASPTSVPLEIVSLTTTPGIVATAIPTSAPLDIDPACDTLAETCRNYENQAAWRCLNLDQGTFDSNESAEECCAQKLPEYHRCLNTLGLVDCSGAPIILDALYQSSHRLRSCQILGYSTGVVGQLGLFPRACSGAAEMCGKFFSHGYECTQTLAEAVQQSLPIPVVQQIKCCDDSISSYAQCIHISQRAPECVNEPELASQASLVKTTFEAVCQEEMPMMSMASMSPTPSPIPMNVEMPRRSA